MSQWNDETITLNTRNFDLEVKFKHYRGTPGDAEDPEEVDIQKVLLAVGDEKVDIFDLIVDLSADETLHEMVLDRLEKILEDEDEDEEDEEGDLW